MKKMILSLGILAALCDSPALANHAPGAGHTIIKVNGLVCDFCARAVEKVFSKKAEVAAVRVDLGKHQIEIDLKEKSDIPDDEIKKLIMDAGYNLVEIKRL